MSLHPLNPTVRFSIRASQKMVLHIVKIGVVHQPNASSVFGRRVTAAVVLAEVIANVTTHYSFPGFMFFFPNSLIQVKKKQTLETE
jgi:hypothetical protein